MRKILVIGSSGAGKSTLARKLGTKTGIKIIHLDKIYWKPNWTEPSKDEWRETLEHVMREEDSWIMDGNFSGTFDIRLSAADMVIFLDMPPLICVWRVLKRVVFSYNRTRADMAEGCPEKFDLEFLKWIWNFEKRSKAKMEKLLAQYENEKAIVRLKSKKEVANFLRDLPGE